MIYQKLFTKQDIQFTSHWDQGFWKVLMKNVCFMN